MTSMIRAHFDVKVIVPDEPVDLPIDQALDVLVSTLDTTESGRQGRLRRLREATGRIEGPAIHEDALRRENLYENR